MSGGDRGCVRGLAFDTSWHSATRVPCVATVHSSFPHAINLDWGEELLSLVTAKGKRAPGVFLTDASRFPPVITGFEVAIGSGWVDVGDLHVFIADAVEFSCEAKPPEVLSPAAPATLSSELEAVAVTGSFLKSPQETPYSSAVRRRLEAGRIKWRCALEHADAGGVAGLADYTTEVASHLVGLGCGLTPSGDDYLLGALSVLHHLPNDQFEGLTEALADSIGEQVHRTTAVSAHFLVAGSDGRFHSDLAEAAIAALTGNNLRRSFRRVNDIGSTSGFDTLVGLVDTLSALTVHPALPAKSTGPTPILEGTLS